MKNLVAILFLFAFSFVAMADNFTFFKGPQLVTSNQSIVASAGITQLTATSAMNTIFTGTNTHTVKLPDTGTLLIGFSFKILNKSTGAVTVNDFSNTLLSTINTGEDKTFILFSSGWEISAGGGSGGAAGGYGGATEIPSYINNGGGNITVNQVKANLWDNSTFVGSAKNYTISAITATLTDNVTNYIIGDYNGGSPTMRVTTDVNKITESNIVPLLTIFRSGTILHSLNWGSLGLGLANKVHQSIVKTQRYRRESGLAISESGTRNVNVTAGILWVGANKQSISSIASLTDNIFYFQRTAPSSWTLQFVTQYNNTDYFNGTTTASLSAGRYAVNWLYRGAESQKHLYMVLGEGNYTLAQAQASQPPSSLPSTISSHAFLVGRIIALRGASTAAQIDSAFNVVFTQQATSIHNDLASIQGGTAGEYYHLTQSKFNAVENLTASGTQTNFTGDVQSASCVYYGSSTVDGSFRDCQSGSAIIRSKRISGSWSEVSRVE